MITTFFVCTLRTNIGIFAQTQYVAAMIILRIRWAYENYCTCNEKENFNNWRHSRCKPSWSGTVCCVNMCLPLLRWLTAWTVFTVFQSCISLVIPKSHISFKTNTVKGIFWIENVLETAAHCRPRATLLTHKSVYWRARQPATWLPGPWHTWCLRQLENTWTEHDVITK